MSLQRSVVATSSLALMMACSGTDAAGPTRVATVSLTAPVSSIKATHTLVIEAKAVDVDGNLIENRSFQWSSDNSAVAAVDQNGVVRGVSAGSATITAAADGKFGIFPIIVTRAPLATISISNPPGNLSFGQTARMQAVVTDSAGNTVTDVELAWRSSDLLIARVDPSGNLTAFVPGTVVIEASAEGITGSRAITIVPMPFIRFKSITGGQFHTCGLSIEGAAFCWGNDLYGALGAGEAPPIPDRCPVQPARSCSSIPYMVSGGHVFTSLSDRSFHHTCATDSEGTWCWGEGTHGEIGNGVSGVTVNAVPTKVRSSVTYTATSTGGYHSCGLTTLRAIDCWGTNELGQLGDPTAAEMCPRPGSPSEQVLCATIPRRVASSLAFSKVSGGNSQTCALSEEGIAYCWGYIVGEALNAVPAPPCGIHPCNNAPTRVVTELRFTDISAGDVVTCAISTAGRAYCWGDNTEGQLGTGKFAGREPRPVPVNSSSNFVKIYSGSAFACALDSDGAAFCWGDNQRGQLGDGSTTNRATPVPVQLGLRFNSLALGLFHTCGIATDGYAYCWGNNATRQLGIGRDGLALTPTRVAGQ